MENYYNNRLLFLKEWVLNILNNKDVNKPNPSDYLSDGEIYIFRFPILQIEDILNDTEIAEYIEQNLPFYYLTIVSGIGACLEQDTKAFEVMYTPNGNIGYSVDEFFEILLNCSDYWLSFYLNKNEKDLINEGLDLKEVMYETAQMFEEMMYMLLLIKHNKMSKFTKDNKKLLLDKLSQYFKPIYEYYESVEDYMYCADIKKIESYMEKLYREKKTISKFSRKNSEVLPV